MKEAAKEAAAKVPALAQMRERMREILREMRETDGLGRGDAKLCEAGALGALDLHEQGKATADDLVEAAAFLARAAGLWMDEGNHARAAKCDARVKSLLDAAVVESVRGWCFETFGEITGADVDANGEDE